MDPTTLLQYAQHAVNYALRNWPALAGYGGLATFIVIMLQYFKRALKLDEKSVRLLKFIKLEGPHLVAMLYTIGVALGTGYTWLIDPTNAKYVPDRFAFILTFGFFIHRFLVSPQGQKLEEKLRPYLLAVEQIKASEQAKTSQIPVYAPTTSALPGTTLTPAVPMASPMQAAQPASPGQPQ